MFPFAGKELQLADDVFKLQHLLDCNILHHRDEIEELTTAAVKEEQIEIKLAGIESDWVVMNLVSPASPALQCLEVMCLSSRKALLYLKVVPVNVFADETTRHTQFVVDGKTRCRQFAAQSTRHRHV